MIALLLKLLAEGRNVEIEVAGMSMAPLLLRGDRILIAPIGERDFRLHDIVVLRTEGRLLAHRVIALHPLRTEGDQSLEIDPEWPPDSVVGRVVAFRRGPRLIKLGSPEGLLRNWWSRFSRWRVPRQAAF